MVGFVDGEMKRGKICKMLVHGIAWHAQQAPSIKKTVVIGVYQLLLHNQSLKAQ